MHRQIIILFFILSSGFLRALEVHDYSVKISSKVDSSSGFDVEIFWEADPKALSYEIYLENSGSFNLVQTISGNENSYTFFDAEYFQGQSKEVMIEKEFSVADSSTKGWGYLEIGYGIPIKESKGNVIIGIDNIAYDSIRTEIEEYKDNLNLSGFNAEIIQVPRAEHFNAKAILQTKQIFKAKYQQLEERLDYIVLVGRVAVPLSGSASPDGHSYESAGAWPADGFYGDFDGKWTDYLIDTVREGLFLDYHNNSAWDGKWDQTNFPSKLEASVGRIDVSKQEYFEENEFELLRGYFRKNNKFRNGGFDYPRRALIDDKFHLLFREVFAAEAWMNFSALVGYNNIDSMNARYHLRENPYLFFWGAASGGYDGIHETAYSIDYSKYDYLGIFGFIFGSRIVEWTVVNNTMKAMIASNPSFLTSLWTVRPYWHLHGMGVGKTIGKSALYSMNTGEKYRSHQFEPYVRAVFMNIIGDPTLEMLVVDPPENVLRTDNNGKVKLTWTAPEGINGFNIYFAEDISSEKIKLNDNLIKDNSFEIEKQGGVFIIKSVKLQKTNSASYWQESIGKIAD